LQLRDVVIGAVFAAAAALLAYRTRALSSSGAVAAFVVGALTYATGTFRFTLVLLAFFVPSVVLSRIGRTRKHELVDAGKHGPRDATQVLANGGVATLCALGWAYTLDSRWAVALAGAYAAATADTWGTEIGTLARGTPRSILTLRPVVAGLSGGVTSRGTLAEIAGAIWIGLAAGIAVPRAYIPAPAAVFVVPVAGIAGALLDSILGATLQELRFCDACGRSCETNPHACGTPTRLIRGIPRFSNDVVNLLATACGAGVAFALA